MTASVRDAPERSRYELVLDGEVVGTAAYELDGEAGRVTFTHTEVDDGHEGQGLGRRLVTGALEDAERRGLGVVPVCPYVRKVVARDPGRWLRLVPSDVRERLGLHLLRE